MKNNLKKYIQKTIPIPFAIVFLALVIAYWQKIFVSVSHNRSGTDTQQTTDAETASASLPQAAGSPTTAIDKALKVLSLLSGTISEHTAPEEDEYNNEAFFYQYAKEQRLDRLTADNCWKRLLADNVFQDDSMRLTGLVIEDMDHNGQDDLMVMILNRDDWAYYGTGCVWFYMNDDAPYCFDADGCSYYGSFDFFAEDIDNDDHVELVLSTQGTGCGATGDFYKAVFKYKDHDITRMELPSDLEGDYDWGIRITVTQEAEKNRYSAYCSYFDETIFFTSENIFQPNGSRCVGGSNVRGFYDLRPVKYAGKNALQASEYLSGEGGNVHNVATAKFIILWDQNGHGYVDKWWIETSEHTYANSRAFFLCHNERRPEGLRYARGFGIIRYTHNTYNIFFISSATNCTLVPTITCTEVLPGLITPATPADLIFFSSTSV